MANYFIIQIILVAVVLSKIEASADMTGNQTKNGAVLENFCSVSDSGRNCSVHCNLNSDDTFSFLNFRQWSKDKENSTSITLSIECHKGGKLKLPWPYRAYNLVSLYIKGCTLDDNYLEFNKTHHFKNIEDRLQHIELVDSVQIIDVVKYTEYSIQVEQRNIAPEFECGFQNAVRYVKRNLTSELDMGDYFDGYDYYDYNDTDIGEQDSDQPNNQGKELATTKSPQEIEEEDEAVRQGVVRSSLAMKHLCHYPNWEYYEISYNNEIGKFHLQGLTANSKIPKLMVINFTHTLQNFVQTELLNWRLHFPSLEILDMTYCLVSQFQFQDYTEGGPKKGYINLQYNNISSLGPDEIKSFRSLQSTIIDVKNNPFHCECDKMTYLVEFFAEHDSPKKAGLHADYHYLWDLKCVSPDKFNGRVISELSKEILCDLDVSIYIAQIASLSVVIVILFIIIIVVLKYRREIRILVFTRLHIILPCEPVEDDKQYQYDAFISYSSNDAEWVLKTLAKFLEDPQSDTRLSLCLHHRDFQVGEYICDNIITSVEKSRHTVLVVSKNFLKSEWCVFEFREALRKSLLDKRKHMIIVLLEDIDTENLDSDFRRSLQTMTNIKSDDSLFWDRIKYALAPKSRLKSNEFSGSFKNKSFSSQNEEDSKIKT